MNCFYLHTRIPVPLMVCQALWLSEQEIVIVVWSFCTQCFSQH